MIKRIINCDLDNLRDLSKGEHSLEEVLKRTGLELPVEGKECGYESAKDWLESEGGEK